VTNPVAYSNYSRLAEPKDGSLEREFDDLLDPDIFRDKPIHVNFLLSFSSIAIHYLQESHNESMNDPLALKYSKLLGIEIGLVFTTALLAPLESLIRLAVSAIFAIIGIFYEDALDFAIINATVTPLYLVQGAVSSYTNIAYHNQKIDYLGQARCHLLQKQLPQ